jgi:hypothetical protein
LKQVADERFFIYPIRKRHIREAGCAVVFMGRSVVPTIGATVVMTGPTEIIVAIAAVKTRAAVVVR